MKNKHPITSAEKQSRRVTALDAIAQAAGWGTWTKYETGVKNGVVKIEKNPQRRNMTGKMHSIVVRYPRKQNGKTGEFENWYRMEKKFSNQENAEKWARECEQDVERDKGNLWPTDVLVDGVSVESSDKIYTRF